MEVKKDVFGMLDLMVRPVFCVKENKIVYGNSAAQALLLTSGTDVRTLLMTGQEEYAAFSDGCLYLKLALSSKGCGASVSRLDGYDVFLLDQETDDAELQAMALAARELREPLTSIMISAERLFPLADPQAGEQAARLNRGLHQLLRLVGNMSDAGRYSSIARQEYRDLSAMFQEIFEKAQTLIQHTGIRLTWQGLSQEILGLADAEQLERAVFNILSNAVKFTPKSGTITASLSRHGSLLRLSITDSGSGIAENVRRELFHRYLRQPGIEDGRCGIGLGMVLIRAAAANHGGTVLVDQPGKTGTRVTMTLAIRQHSDHILRSPIMRVDYAGERDHGLIELADCLPISLYETEK
ncbi:MAG: HAMP domain-containing histidine kinase [Oscillospiraceae bacterium]|nr:HAMP domain-containing histidine kinase [Oscillospiraceae bacterium]